MNATPDNRIRADVREGLIITTVALLIIIIFGLACLYSVSNSLEKDKTCVVCVNGTNSTFAIGNVVTLPCHSAATVTNSGNTSDVILNFGIPGGCAGQKGINGSSRLVVNDTSMSTYIYSSNTTFPTRLIYVNVSNNASFVIPAGIQGPQGPTGPPGPPGPQGIQGIQGIQGPPAVVPGVARYVTPGSYNVPIPAGSVAVFYTLVGGGGGGGGSMSGGNSGNHGAAGGGGGSGRMTTGFELLTGATNCYIQVGAGGNGGISSDSDFVLSTSGANGNPSILQIIPSTSAAAGGGIGGQGAEWVFSLGGNGGDGGYGGGGGGSQGVYYALGGISFNLNVFSTASQGGAGSGSGGDGAGPNAGAGGAGIAFQTFYRLYTGGGGGGGGPVPLSGGDGGTYLGNQFAGKNGISGGGGGGSAGTFFAPLYVPPFTSVLGKNGGKGGDGYIELIFV